MLVHMYLCNGMNVCIDMYLCYVFKHEKLMQILDLFLQIGEAGGSSICNTLSIAHIYSIAD